MPLHSFPDTIELTTTEGHRILKLELDWAAEDGTPRPEGVDPTDPNVRVELGPESGPSGWPVVYVYVAPEPGAPAYEAYMALDGWLRDVYGEQDEDAREELSNSVEEV